MENTKEKLFEIKHDTKLDKLIIKKARLSSKIRRWAKTHKLMTTAISAFIMFSILNIVMIYSFMKILQNI